MQEMSNKSSGKQLNRQMNLMNLRLWSCTFSDLQVYTMISGTLAIKLRLQFTKLDSTITNSKKEQTAGAVVPSC
jgi:hypothetical protein